MSASVDSFKARMEASIELNGGLGGRRREKGEQQNYSIVLRLRGKAQ